MKSIATFMFSLLIALPGVAIADDAPTQDAATETTAPAVESHPYSGDWMSRSKMTGDWGGPRAELAEKGFLIEFDMTQILQSNTTGGANTTNGVRYSGSGDLTFTLDTTKAGLWPAATIVINAEPKWGNGINEKVGALLPVNYDATKPNDDPCTMTLSEYFIVQGLYQGPIGKFAIALGKADLARILDTNMFANDERTQFMNTGFRNNPLIAPFAGYTGMAVALIYLPTDWLRITTAWGDASGEASTTMSSTGFHGSDDEFSVGNEWEFTIKPFGQLGHQRVAWAWSGKDSDHVNPITPFKQAAGTLVDMLGLDMVNKLSPFLPKESSTSNWVFLYGFDQYLCTEEEDPDQGLGIFGRFGVTASDVNAADSFYSVGLSGKGLIDTRDDDVLGLAYYYLNLSDRLPPQLQSEQAVELYYNIAVTPWCTVSPDLQVIVDPGGTSSSSTSIVAGIRTQINF